MAGIAKPMGTIVLRQTYNKPGHNYMVMTVPAAMYEAMGWRPGDEMAFYPVRYENGLEAMLLVLQHAAVSAAIPNLDTEKLKRRTVPLRGPRPGSIAEREIACDSIVQGLLDRHEDTRKERLAAKERKAELERQRPYEVMEDDGFGGKIKVTVDPNWKENWLKQQRGEPTPRVRRLKKA